MSLQAESALAHVHAPRSRRERCPVPDCPALPTDPVEIQLPAVWDAREQFTVLTALLLACPEHARELRRRSDELLAARADFRNLLADRP